ncbi:recombinase RecT [Vagococcus hydrophili]|uniref:Recombinase RecT n=1 Tax=Vagococcus hydrophili TaxID=2714947 RepID=A0A6G8APQ8_9ENTE|nr:recombinase RecT [Vagococcus hydrophili]QIL47061.1 recombinase RecT [Vagococcus hydrophili]
MTNQAPAVYKSQLAKINDTYMPQIETQLHGNGINMTEYQRTCVINSISSINELLVKEGLDMSKIDQSNLTQTLMQVAALQLNATATPREVYFIKRNQKVKNGQPIQIIEMGIEGDGNDAILSRFGRNIKQVHRHWEVREDDGFTYPGYAGITVTPPSWNPKGTGKIVRVVYPVEFNDGQVEFYISEREDVKANLLAHMYNNLMWDKDKDNKKPKIKEFAETHSLDEILDDEEMQKIGNISPAWKEPQSRESMIVRKMRNRIVKKIPKDFSNAYIQQIADNVDDDFQERQLQRKEAVIIDEIEENANSEVFEPINKVDNERPANVTEDGEIQNGDFSEVTDQEPIEESSDPY